MSKSVFFSARLQKHRRIQVPRLLRWKHRLDVGEVFEVKIYTSCWQHFYARLNVGGYFVIPKIAAEKLGVKHGDIIEITLKNPDYTD